MYPYPGGTVSFPVFSLLGARLEISWVGQITADLPKKNLVTVLNGREVTVPVPWGEIRGREWGSEDGVPWIGNTACTKAYKIGKMVIMTLTLN